MRADLEMRSGVKLKSAAFSLLKTNHVRNCHFEPLCCGSVNVVHIAVAACNMDAKRKRSSNFVPVQFGLIDSLIGNLCRLWSLCGSFASVHAALLP